MEVARFGAVAAVGGTACPSVAKSSVMHLRSRPLAGEVGGIGKPVLLAAAADTAPSWSLV